MGAGIAGLSQRPRPVNDAATRQIWYSVLGAIAPGLIYLAAVLQSGRAITVNDLVAAGLAILLPLAAAETARRRTVAESEAEVTPVESPRDNTGEVLRSRDRDLYEQAIAEVAETRAAGADPLRPPTSRFPDLGPAQSMRADALAAADGPPSKQPHYDYAGDRVRAYDEDLARERGRDPDVRRGREIAGRRDRVSAQRPRHHFRNDDQG